MKYLLNVILLGILAFAVVGCSDDDNPTAPGGSQDDGTIVRFEGDFAADHWASSGIEDGTTAIEPESGAADSLVFTYAVSLGGGGVTGRTTDFTMTAPANGVVTLEWRYHGFHAWYQAYVGGELWADTPSGTAEMPLVDESVYGPFTFTGTAVITVFEGMDYGFELGGGNYDSDSRLLGDLTITDFRFVPADPPSGG